LEVFEDFRFQGTVFRVGDKAPSVTRSNFEVEFVREVAPQADQFEEPFLCVEPDE
jgi:hypothetical protein